MLEKAIHKQMSTQALEERYNKEGESQQLDEDLFKFERDLAKASGKVYKGLIDENARFNEASLT